MSNNIAIQLDHIDACEDLIPHGQDIFTYMKPCFFIYDQNAETCTIRIVDKSDNFNKYSQFTDSYTIGVIVIDAEGNICSTQTLAALGSLTVDLPSCGKFQVQIDLQYTILYDDNGTIIPFTFQWVSMYCVSCDVCGDRHNSLYYDITCRISKTECEIVKRKKVGRVWDKLQDNIYALENYLYAICNFEFTDKEYEMISCAVKGIKKVC